ncbi:peptidase M24, structural domain-containing protein [Phycomyces nitens]|nr:peptidase M24, structural domain-containing protein [Phycomyces nitens]
MFCRRSRLAQSALVSRLQTPGAKFSHVQRPNILHRAVKKNTGASYSGYRTFTATPLSNPIPDTHKRSFGQPTVHTHPYLIGKDDLTPGIPKSEYELRRTILMSSLPKGSTVVSVGYKTRYMTNNIFYQFHQNTDFWYLCGFNEPDSAMILQKDDSPRGYKQIMFVPPKSAHAELWDGPRTGVEGAKDVFGADEAYDNSRFNLFLKDAMDSDNLFIDSPSVTPSLLSEDRNKKVIEAAKFKRALKPLSSIIQEMRMIKSDNEIEIMKKSGQISSKAFIQAMKWTQPNFSEGQLWAKLDYECRMRGSSMLAYVPVVAGGPNALSMHYVRNDMNLRDGDLVLVDCGGEYNGYASDITRTWPVNGKFTEPQREIYQAVLNVNKACIKLCTEDAKLSLHGIHSESVRLMKKELDAIGFSVTNSDLENILYPHHVGHYLGLDVHDLHDISRSRTLKKNMVITIEPGLYIPYNKKFPSKYHGIGIRIEDNVVIGEETPYVLTATAPKEVIDIEHCCKSTPE